MVTILIACALALALLALAEFIALAIKTEKLWELQDRLYDMEAVEPIIDEDGRWQDWDG